MLNNKFLSFILKILPFAITIILIIFYITSGDSFTVENIVERMSSNFFISAAVLLGMYAVKSVSVVFPLIVLYIVGGTIFPLPLALLINLIGIAVINTLPYFIGYFSGSQLTEKLYKKYSKASNFLKNTHSDFVISYFLRAISFIPGDIISMYLGSKKLNYCKYMIGSLLGMLPGMITSTVIGSSIQNPLSPGFLISVTIQALLLIISFIAYRYYRNRKV